MKRILCIIVAMSFILALMACEKQTGRETITEEAEQEEEQQDALVFENWEYSDTDIIVPISPEEDREWVESKVKASFDSGFHDNLKWVWRYAMSFRKEGALPYECTAQYNLSSFPKDERSFFRFPAPNDFYEVMVYNGWGESND